MKKIDKRIKKRIGGLVILVILSSIFLYPTISGARFGTPPDRILMEDDEWIGNYDLNEDPTGSIHFDEGFREPEIEIMGGRVGVGALVPLAKIHTQTDHVTELGVLKDGVWFEQQFVATLDNDEIRALQVTPTFSNPGFNGVDNIGINVEPIAMDGATYTEIKSGIVIDDFIEDWNGVYFESPQIASRGITGRYAMVTEPFVGNVGFGTITPNTQVHIWGPAPGVIQIQDTTQQEGYVLTSDANGVGTWQTPTGGGCAQDLWFTFTSLDDSITVPADILQDELNIDGQGIATVTIDPASDKLIINALGDQWYIFSSQKAQ